LPRTVEPDWLRRTAGAVGRDEPHFQIGNTECLFCTVNPKAVSLRKIVEHDHVRIDVYGVPHKRGKSLNSSWFSLPFGDGDDRGTAFGFLATGSDGDLSLISLTSIRNLPAIRPHLCPCSAPHKPSSESAAPRNL
jgi:hypothetical protein